MTDAEQSPPGSLACGEVELEKGQEVRVFVSLEPSPRTVPPDGFIAHVTDFATEQGVRWVEIQYAQGRCPARFAGTDRRQWLRWSTQRDGRYRFLTLEQLAERRSIERSEKVLAAYGLQVIPKGRITARRLEQITTAITAHVPVNGT